MQIGLESAAWQAYHPRVRWQCPRAWVGIYAYMASSTRKGAMPELVDNVHGILSIYKHSPVCDTLVCMVCGPVNGRPTSTLYGWVQLNDCMGHREDSYLSPAWDLSGRCFRGMWPPVEQRMGLPVSTAVLLVCILYTRPLYIIFNPAMHVSSPLILYAQFELEGDRGSF